MVESYWLYEDQLQDVYQETFETVKTYVNTSSIDEKTRSELLHSLLDLLLTAQEKGTPPEKVIGSDVERFCKTYCSATGTKEHVMYYLEKTMGVIHWLFLLSCVELCFLLVDMLHGKKVNWFTYHGENNVFQYGVGLLCIALLGIGVDFLIKRHLFQKRKQIIGSAFFKGILICLVVGFGIAVLYAYMKQINLFPDIPCWLMFLLTGCMTIVYSIATRTYRKEKKSYQMGLWKYMSALTKEEGMPQYEKDRYFCANKKREKKGLSKLTQEEYLTMEQEKCETLCRNPFHIRVVLPSVLVGILIGMGIGIWHGKEETCRTAGEILSILFETPVDAVCFFLIILLVCGVFLYGIWKISQKENKKRLFWIKEELANPTVWEDSRLDRRK